MEGQKWQLIKYNIEKKFGWDEKKCRKFRRKEGGNHLRSYSHEERRI